LRDALVLPDVSYARITTRHFPMQNDQYHEYIHWRGQFRVIVVGINRKPSTVKLFLCKHKKIKNYFFKHFSSE